MGCIYERKRLAGTASVKTGRSWVGGSELCVWGSKVTGDKGDTMFYPGSGPLNGGKTLRPA